MFAKVDIDHQQIENLFQKNFIPQRNQKSVVFQQQKRNAQTTNNSVCGLQLPL